jgi:hypothetical protein
MPTALTAMRQGASRSSGNARERAVSAVVFHGDKDTTVNVRNGDAVAARSGRTRNAEEGQVPGGCAYDRTMGTDATGRVVLEH